MPPYIGLFRTSCWVRPNRGINYNFCNSFIFNKINYFNIQFIDNISKLNRRINTLTTQHNLKNSYNLLHPDYVIGLTDVEGTFLISIRPKPRMKTGYSIELFFKITLHLRDRGLLEKLQTYFNKIGTITNVKSRKSGSGGQYTTYWVGSIKYLEIIINHFDKYPLITQKWSDYQLFKQAFLLIKDKQHLTPEGLNKIVEIKSVLNKGLSDELKSDFPNIVPVSRPVLKNKIINPNWVVGFVDAEGCFFVNMKNSPKSQLGIETGLSFSVAQHLRDGELLKKFGIFLGCGRFYPRHSSKRLRSYFVTSKFKDIISKIIPFAPCVGGVDKYPLVFNFPGMLRTAAIKKTTSKR